MGFGLAIRRKFAGVLSKAANTLSPVGDNRGGWWPWIREPYTGAWQRNDEWHVDTVLAHHAVYACITLIASDIGKLRPKLMEMDANGIWTETTSPAFSPVLRRPNRYQNRIQFQEWYATSKAIRGNTYVLKERDSRDVVVAHYILDPSRVQVLVAPDGEVFYQVGSDNLTGLDENSVQVPAREIIHDRINCLFHPLVGVSPLFACGMAANIGLRIERNSNAFFGQGSNPSGILTGPLPINDDTAKRLSDRWNSEYAGQHSGRVAVIGNDLKFQQLRMSAVESQLIEQLRWTAETVCSAFHVPPFKVGIGNMPTYQNGETLNQIYYSDCLQAHIEQFELSMDEGLGIGIGSPKDGKTLGVELDLDGLFRMDSATQTKTLAEGVKGGILAPNEARRKLDLKPVAGGDTPYLQQQNYSLAALDKRDAKGDPFAKEPSTTSALPAPSDDQEDADDETGDENEERAAFISTVSLNLLAYTNANKARRLKLLGAGS